MRTLRTGKVNEKYYAKNDHPSYPQIKNHHLYDERGRLYEIAQENGDLFQNENLRMTPDTGVPKISSDGVVTVYVKLSKKAAWFGENEMNQEIILKSRVGRQEYLVTLISAIKPDPRRRAGIVELRGLDFQQCELLISSNNNKSSL